MKTIYFTRHGQTLFNRQKKIQGFCDSPLTELGIRQAEIARQYIDEMGLTFDDAYASTSERACDTLEILTDIRYKRIKGLKEWNFGDFEGEGEHLNPPLPYGDFFVQFGGEDEVSFKERITSTVKTLVDQSDGEHILIVSHGASIAQFYRAWEDKSEVKRTGRIQNCSIFKYEYHDGIFELKEIFEPVH